MLRSTMQLWDVTKRMVASECQPKRQRRHPLRSHESMKRVYVTKDFKSTTLDIIGQANSIIEEYQEDGYILTLRQLYYQFVARDLLPNTQKSYSRLGSIVNDGRLSGLIDWEAIEDRTRAIRQLRTWESAKHAVEYAAGSYLSDKWLRQPSRVEVWVEKEALTGVFEGICDDLEVPVFACRGYVSQSEMWRAAQRHRDYESNAGQCVTILHFGDHDPSGIDMTRDVQDRLHMFRSQAEVKRVALNMDQVRAYNPPPNPAKVTDSRFKVYQTKFGEESWELDALEPRVLVSLVESEVRLVRDERLWLEAEKEESDDINQLYKLALTFK